MANLISDQSDEFPPLPEDEYDRYLLRLRTMLSEEASEESMMLFLAEAEEHIGMGSSEEAKRIFLNALVEANVA